MNFESRYFWLMDNELPTEMIRGYLTALEDESDTTLKQILRLVEKRIPVTPKAYLTSGGINALEKKQVEPLFRELDQVLGRFEKSLHRQFAGYERPLLLTVRGDLSGAIRNIGCCPNSLRAMVHDSGTTQAYSTYISFLESFCSLVLGCPHIDFKGMFGIQADREGGSSNLGALTETEFLKKVQEYQNLVGQKIGAPFPEKPARQLLLSIAFASKSGKQAGHEEIFIETQLPYLLDPRSVSGMAYTRNPFSGKKDLYGVFSSGGERKKFLLEPDAGEAEGSEAARNSLRDRFPQLYLQIKKALPDIEGCFREVVEAQFVADPDGHLNFTHFDKAQTTAKATITNAIELNVEGKITDVEAALRIHPKDVEVLLHSTLDDKSRAKLKDVGSTGVTAAPGTAIGAVFFTMADAMDYYRTAVKNKTDKRVILIADELLISDTPGLGIIQGLVTKASGIASHAAVMARANGIPCIVGYRGLEVHAKENHITVNDKKIKSGTVLTLEANSEGHLFEGEGTLQNLSFQEGVVRDVAQLFTRVAKQQQIPFEVRVNINNAKDAQTGLNFGADGVGLCRTENMFMETEALREIRNIVFTQDVEQCSDSLKNLEEMQFQDFQKIFLAMRGRTVNIRLMDLPLHDFVPQNEEGFKELEAQLKHLSSEKIRAVSETLREHNPMLGLRACRFGLITPPVYDMQIRAIIRAAYTVKGSNGDVHPGIMFPLVFSEQELKRLKARVVEIERLVREDLKVALNNKIDIKVGSMIELPAAALNTDHLSKIGEFFAFGTNDLTQTTLGMSRDDSAHYLPQYLEKGLLPSDPFKVLAEPVRQLIEIAVSRGQRVRRDVSFGICGEQGGDPATLLFCLQRHLNYVSCSPFRVLPTKVALVQIANQHGLVKHVEFHDGSNAGRGDTHPKEEELLQRTS